MPDVASAVSETVHDAPAIPERLVLYDGVCGLCDRFVQWLLARDREGAFRFAPLQGETAAAIRARHPEIPERLDSILYVETAGGEERVYWESRAVFRVCRELPGGWKALSWLRVVPRFVTDAVYRLVARVRYRVFGKYETCKVPSAAQRARFLP